MRNASTIVAYSHTKIVFDVYFYPVASMHLKLVDRVVEHLFEQHVDTIFRQRAIAKTSDIHTRTCAHMLHVAKVSDVVVVIFHRLLGCRRKVIDIIF